MKRIEDGLRDLWDNIKCTNSQIIGVPKEEEKKKVSLGTVYGIFLRKLRKTYDCTKDREDSSGQGIGSKEGGWWGE